MEAPAPWTVQRSEVEEPVAVLPMGYFVASLTLSAPSLMASPVFSAALSTVSPAFSIGPFSLQPGTAAKIRARTGIIRTILRIFIKLNLSDRVSHCNGVFSYRDLVGLPQLRSGRLDAALASVSGRNLRM